MIRLLSVCLIVFSLLTGTARAQDDNSYLANLVQDSLSAPGREVRLIGVVGLLRSDARIAEITVADTDGVWLRITNAQINWTRSALLRKALEVESLTAEQIEVIRKPIPTTTTTLPSAEAQSFSLPELPVMVNIGQIAADRIILPQELIGIAATLTIDASVSLDATGLDFSFVGERLDGPGGTVDISAQLLREANTLSLDATLFEPENGVIANAIGLTGRPALRSTIAGRGLLSDMAITLDLSADQTQIAGGIINLKSDGEDYIFTTDLTARLAELVDPVYRDFFAGESVVTLSGRRLSDGSIVLSEVAVKTGELDLSGSIAFEPSGFPEQLDITATLAASGARVQLPFSDGETSLAGASVDLSFGVVEPNIWTADFGITDLQSTAISVDQLSGSYRGSVTNQEGSTLNGIAGTLKAEIDGLLMQDAGLDAALGNKLALETRLDWQTDAPLVLHWLRINADSFSATARGRLSGMTFKGTADADIGQLDAFSILANRELSGAARANISGEIGLLDLISDLKFDVTGDDLSVDIARLDPYLAGTSTLTGVFARNESGTRLQDLIISSPIADIAANISLSSEDVAFDLDLTATEVSHALPPLTGAGEIHMQGAGPWASFPIEGELSTNSGVRLAITGTAGQNLDLTLDVTNVPLDLSADFVPSAGLQGNVTGKAEIVGPMDAPDVGFTLKADNFKSLYTKDYFPSVLALTTTGRWSAAGLNIETFTTSGDEVSIAGSGLISADFETINATVNGTLPLRTGAVIMAKAGGVAEGRADLNLTITGQLQSPELNGNLSVEDATITVPAAQLRLNDVNLSAGFTGTGIQLSQFDANVSGGGSLNATGSIGITGGFPVDIAIVMKDAAYSNGRNLATVVSGNLNLSGQIATVTRLTGDLNIGASEIQLSTSSAQLANFIAVQHRAPNRDVVSTLSRAGLTTAGTEAQEQSGRMELDLTVNAPEQVFVRGRGVDSEFGGTIKILGSIGDIQAVGGINMIRGRMNFLDRRIDFTSGTVTMSGSLDPRINFIAETRLTDADVTLTLSGQASAPELTLTSSPDLPEDEILARLIFSRSMEDLSIFQIAKLASAVAELSGSGGGGVVEDLRRAAGLSNLDIRTTDQGETAVAAGGNVGDGIYTEIEATSSGDTKLNINLDVLDNVTARGSVASDGETSVGIFYERDY